MGLVFEGVHRALGGRAAIKLLRPEYSGRPDVTARFFNEARAANAIQHPGIVRIFDCGYTPNHIGFLAMEYLAGESLRSRLDRVQQLSVAESLQIGRQTAAALHAAHCQRVIHRDLKPDNLMLVPDTELVTGERVKVLDFGIAKVAEELSAQGVRTQSNMLMGTPLYMPPEQCRGARYVTDKSDVYALGVILFQMLAGRTPFVGEGIGELAAMHLIDAPPELMELAPHVDPALSRLVRVMLAKQGAARPGMDEVLETIQSLMHRPESAAPTARAAAQPPPGTSAHTSVHTSVHNSADTPTSLTPLPSLAEGPELPSLKAGAEEPTQSFGLHNLRQVLPKKERPIAEEPTRPLAALHLRPHPPQPQPSAAPSVSPGQVATVAEVASEVQRPQASGSRRKVSIGIGLLAGLSLVAAVLHFGQSPRGTHGNMNNYSHSATALPKSVAPVSAAVPAPVPAPGSPEAGSSSAPKAAAPEVLTIVLPEAVESTAAPSESAKKGVEPDRALGKAQSALHAENYAEATYWGARCLYANKLRCSLISALASCKSKGAHDSQPHIERINTALNILEGADKSELVAAVHTVCAEYGLRTDSHGRYPLPLALRPFPNLPELRPGAETSAPDDKNALGAKCVDQATQHLAAREYTRALRMAEICVSGLGGSVRRSWTIISYAACMLGEQEKALDAFARIKAMKAEPSTENLVIQLCKSRGITLVSNR